MVRKGEGLIITGAEVYETKVSTIRLWVTANRVYNFAERNIYISYLICMEQWKPLEKQLKTSTFSSEIDIKSGSKLALRIDLEFTPCTHTYHIKGKVSVETHDSIDNHVREEVFVVGNKFGAHRGRCTLFQEGTQFPENARNKMI